MHISKTLFALLLSTFFLCYIPFAAEAQDSETYRITTTDGSVYIGVLISESDESVTIRTKSVGEITINKSNIAKMTQLNGDRLREDGYWHENPLSTRYLFAPSAHGLKKGAGYYQNTWIFLNNVNYGVTNNFSIGAGTVPVFLFGASYFPFWIMPKISIPVSGDQFHLSVGALIGGVIGEDSGGGGLLYGTGTLGDTDRNLTIGLGYAYGEGEISSTPVINLSGMIRTGRNFFLISENYFIRDSGIYGITSFGLRWAPENFSVDFALVRPLEELGTFFGVPWLGVTIPFGK